MARAARVFRWTRPGADEPALTAQPRRTAGFDATALVVGLGRDDVRPRIQVGTRRSQRGNERGEGGGQPEVADVVFAQVADVAVADEPLRLDAARPERGSVEVQAKIANRVVANVRGELATRYTWRDKKIDVLVRSVDTRQSSIEEIRRLIVNPMSDRPVTLDAVADVNVSQGPSEIRRVAQERPIRAVVSTSAPYVEGNRLYYVTAECQLRSLDTRFEDAIVRGPGDQKTKLKALSTLLRDFLDTDTLGR